MRHRRLMLWAGVLLLVSGLFLAANATIIPHNTSFSMRSYSVGMLGSGEYFTFAGVTLTPDNAPQIVAETTTVIDAFILATPGEEFSSWICYQLPASSGPKINCAAGALIGSFNITILDAYLQTHPSVVAISKVIIAQSMTLPFKASVPTNITIVIARLVMPPTNSTDYIRVTYSNQSVTYPTLGWTERSGSIFSLLNISIALASSGAVVLAISKQNSAPSPPIWRRMTPALRKCDSCDGENLSFADRCGHCGTILQKDSLAEPLSYAH